MSLFKFIYSFMRGRRAAYFLCVFAVFISTATMLIPPLLVGSMVDTVLYHDLTSISLIERILGITAGMSDGEMLFRYSMAMIGVTLFSTTLRYILHISLHRIALFTGEKIHMALYEKLQTLSAGFFAETPSGELITNLTSDVIHVKDLIRAHSYSWVRHSMTLIFSLALLFYYNLKLTLILMVFLPVIVFFSMLIYRTTRMLHRRLREKFSEMSSYVNENLGAYRVVKAFAREDYECERLRTVSAQYRDMAVDNTKRRLYVSTPLHLVSRLMSILGLCLAAFFVIKGEMTVGALTVFNSYIFNLQSPLRIITTLISQTQQVMVSTRKIYDLYMLEPEVDNSEHLQSKHGRIRTIEFRDVSLDLGGHRILNHINLKIREGKTLAIMGPTGAGKTILISLLIRLYDPTEGAIYLNGVNIRNIDLQKLRKEIAIATQDVFLFSDTIDSNIAYSNPEMSEETVRAMAETAQAADFIEKLSDGYDTVIGERGIGLSGGQRQRIALARAVAKDSSVIILDDTTSAVDMETEVSILHELQKITNKIKVIVAQRITSVVNADEIIILQNGSITERGTHEQLLEQNGYYAEIYRISRENEEVEHHG